MKFRIIPQMDRKGRMAGIRGTAWPGELCRWNQRWPRGHQHGRVAPPTAITRPHQGSPVFPPGPVGRYSEQHPGSVMQCLLWAQPCAGCGWGAHRGVQPAPCQLAVAQSLAGGQDVPSRENILGSLVSPETSFSARQEYLASCSDITVTGKEVALP